MKYLFKLFVLGLTIRQSNEEVDKNQSADFGFIQALPEEQCPIILPDKDPEIIISIGIYV